MHKAAKLLTIPLIALSLLTLAACAGQTAKQTAANDKKPEGTITPITNEAQMTTNKTTTGQLAAPAAGDKIVVIETDMGTIKFKLFTEQVPEMTKNFEELAKAGKFTNVPFHRVIKDFMIQTGDFDKKNGTGGYSYKGPGTELPDEIVPGLKNLYGTVAMANRGKDTNGSQFFIVTAKDGASFLDGGYTIIGQVYEGMDVADKIADLYIPSSKQAGTPSKIVNMTKATVMPYAP